MSKLKNALKLSRYIVPVAALIANSLSIVGYVSPVSAAPIFSDYPISTTHRSPGAMTVAGGDLWYLQMSSSSASFDSIGRMTTSGVTTDYTIGLPPGTSSFTVKPKLITASDGNIWFYGATSTLVRLGKLDISTGVITFYSPGIADSLANIGTGPDGKIYFSYKSGVNSYLKSFDLATQAVATVKTYDTYSSIGNITSGLDGRLYVSDYYYSTIRAIAITGGTDSGFSTGSTGASSVIVGPDGNLWFVRPNSKIVKATTSGSLTEYDVSSSAVVNTSTQLVAGSDGAVWFFNANTVSSPKVGRITINGTMNTYTVPVTTTGGIRDDHGGPVLGPDGAIWVNYGGYYNGAGKLVRLTAAPTFSDFSITSTYKKPGAMTVAGGDLWYLEGSSASGPIDSIGRMTISGATTDYPIGLPPGTSSFTVSPKLITGPDGNIWFHGSAGGGMRIGKLDIATGAVTFYTGGTSWGAGDIGTGPDGKIYYVYKYSGGPANSYLMSLDPVTGTKNTVKTFDTYSSIGGITTGPDGRIYVTDYYYSTIRAISITGGTNGSFSTGTTGASNLVVGPDSHLWFVKPGNKIVKTTTTGSMTEYDVSTSATVNTSTKLVAGPDGAIWFFNAGTTSSSKIGRITATTGSVTTYTVPVTGGIRDDHGGPVLGPDGAIWINYGAYSSAAGKVVRLGY